MFYLSEAKASRSHRMWAVSPPAPHLLHSGLSNSPSRWRCLHSVLYPVRPVTALVWVLLKDRNLALAPRQGPEKISSRACPIQWTVIYKYIKIHSLRLAIIIKRYLYHISQLHISTRTQQKTLSTVDNTILKAQPEDGSTETSRNM